MVRLEGGEESATRRGRELDDMQVCPKMARERARGPYLEDDTMFSPMCARVPGCPLVDSPSITHLEEKLTEDLCAPQCAEGVADQEERRTESVPTGKRPEPHCVRRTTMGSRRGPTMGMATTLTGLRTWRRATLVDGRLQEDDAGRRRKG